MRATQVVMAGRHSGISRSPGFCMQHKRSYTSHISTYPCRPASVAHEGTSVDCNSIVHKPLHQYGITMRPYILGTQWKKKSFLVGSNHDPKVIRNSLKVFIIVPRCMCKCPLHVSLQVTGRNATWHGEQRQVNTL